MHTAAGTPTVATTARFTARSAWRKTRPPHGQAVEQHFDAEEVFGIIACAVAYDHREILCTGPTGRRTRVASPAAFYHPISIDLVNGDDEGGGIQLAQVGALSHRSTTMAALPCPKET